MLCFNSTFTTNYCSVHQGMAQCRNHCPSSISVLHKDGLDGDNVLAAVLRGTQLGKITSLSLLHKDGLDDDNVAAFKSDAQRDIIGEDHPMLADQQCQHHLPCPGCLKILALKMPGDPFLIHQHGLPFCLWCVVGQS
jgi:hypothetical protein